MYSIIMVSTPLCSSCIHLVVQASYGFLKSYTKHLGSFLVPLSMYAHLWQPTLLHSALFSDGIYTILGETDDASRMASTPSARS